MSDIKYFPNQQLAWSKLKFDVSEGDIALIGCVVTRFLDWLKSRGNVVTDVHAKNLHMDLGATHCNGCPLDFDALLKMDLTPFIEDIIGISKNLDRTTGKLLNFYRPRCARGSGLIIQQSPLIH